MKKEEFRGHVKLVYRYLILTFVMIAIIITGVIYIHSHSNTSLLDNKPTEIIVERAEIDPSEIVDGIHVSTGFKNGEGLPLVIENCIPCHSSKLVIQNRASREGWIGMIRWMQKTQSLWDLGTDEDIIVNYLSKYYAPEEKGRRETLSNIEWYELKTN